MGKAKNFSDIIQEPVITEKSTALSQHGKYTFLVSTSASKDKIKGAFKKFYPKLKVKGIQTIKVRGHKRRSKAGHVEPRDLKKAILTVEGGKVEYFPETA